MCYGNFQIEEESLRLVLGNEIVMSQTQKKTITKHANFSFSTKREIARFILKMFSAEYITL